MDDQRKRVIISEIENWRRNHLLPEHYCIFLLNLYTEGDRPQSSEMARKGSGGSIASGYGQVAATSQGAVARGTKATAPYVSGSAAPISGKMILSWLIGAFLIAGIILLAFHFNRFTPLMQIAIFACFSLICYILAFAFRKSSPLVTHLLLGLSFVVLLLGGFYMIHELGGPLSVLLIYLSIISILLCISAFLFGFPYLLYCGVLALALVYGVATVDRVGDGYTWWRSELYWVPIAGLMVGLGFLVHQNYPKWAGVFAICGMIAFFGAEVQSLYIPTARQDLIQLLLFIKVFLSSAFFFFTRGYWYQWLRL